jgi:ADP-heptose:LPS heptosyltransferase
MEQYNPRILVVLTGSLGDIARGFFLLPWLRAASPRAHISWLVEDRWYEFTKLHPQIDECLVFERKRGLRGALALRTHLRARQFDITLDLQRNFKSGLMSFFSAAPRRIGFHRSNAKEANWLFQTEFLKFHPAGSAKIEQYLEFADYIIPRTLQTERAASEILAARHRRVESGMEGLDLSHLVPSEISLRAPIALVLGSSRANKDWPEHHYRELLERLTTLYPEQQIVLLGDKKQRATATRLQSAIAHLPDTMLNLVGKTSLTELTAVLQSCRLVVGPDSGPTHICALFAVPYICLYGSTDPHRVAPPAGTGHVPLQANLACVPCESKSCAGRGVLCMAMIFPADVVHAIQLALQDLQP